MERDRRSASRTGPERYEDQTEERVVRKWLENYNSMTELNLKADEILTFIPSVIDFQIAKKFYIEIGFDVDYEDDSLAILRKDRCRFFLQNNSNNWIDGNFMMVLHVEDLDAWWDHLEGLNLAVRYPNVRLRAPEVYPWGNREIHLIDPCGVLWHIAVPA